MRYTYNIQLVISRRVGDNEYFIINATGVSFQVFCLEVCEEHEWIVGRFFRRHFHYC
jgi:hypothetical protein